MLVLTIRDGESFTVGAATVTIETISATRVKVKIVAPQDVNVHRLGEAKPRRRLVEKD